MLHKVWKFLGFAERILSRNLLKFLDKLIFVTFVNSWNKRFNLILYLIQFNGTIARNDKITRERFAWGKFRELLLLWTNYYLHIKTGGKVFDICVRNLPWCMARVGVVARGWCHSEWLRTWRSQVKSGCQSLWFLFQRKNILNQISKYLSQCRALMS